MVRSTRGGVPPAFVKYGHVKHEVVYRQHCGLVILYALQNIQCKVWSGQTRGGVPPALWRSNTRWCTASIVACGELLYAVQNIRCKVWSGQHEMVYRQHCGCVILYAVQNIQCNVWSGQTRGGVPPALIYGVKYGQANTRWCTASIVAIYGVKYGHAKHEVVYRQHCGVILYALQNIRCKVWSGQHEMVYRQHYGVILYALQNILCKVCIVAGEYCTLYRICGVKYGHANTRWCTASIMAGQHEMVYRQHCDGVILYVLQNIRCKVWSGQHEMVYRQHLWLCELLYAVQNIRCSMVRPTRDGVPPELWLIYGVTYGQVKHGWCTASIVAVVICTLYRIYGVSMVRPTTRWCTASIVACVSYCTLYRIYGVTYGHANTRWCTASIMAIYGVKYGHAKHEMVYRQHCGVVILYAVQNIRCKVWSGQHEMVYRQHYGVILYVVQNIRCKVWSGKHEMVYRQHCGCGEYCTLYRIYGVTYGQAKQRGGVPPVLWLVATDFTLH
ncbi:hypothetical protein J6590_082563 [Homalodisca vitripennis]|nr:hypothetical protein J6590_082563 [Homalodisca vitripennis]